MATPPKLKASFTNTSGQKKFLYADGTSEYDRPPMAPDQMTADKLIANTEASMRGGQPETISSDKLTPTPDFNITPPKVPTESAGVIGETQAMADSFTAEQTRKRKEAETALTQPKTEMQDFIAKMRGETGLTAEEYAKDSGVDTIQTELDDINQKIRAEQLSLRRKQEAIDARGGGLQSGAQVEKANLERESAKYQADLTIIQQGVQGRYDSAKAIADRAVSAYMEKQKLEYDAIKFNYDENKDLFTKAEQREFDTLLGNRDREIKAEEEKKKNIYDFAIKAMEKGAPSSVVQSIMGSKNISEALKQGAGYFVPKTTTEKPTLQNFGTSDAPNWKQYDPATGTWGAISGLDSVPTVTSPLTIATAKQKVNDIVNLTTNEAIAGAVGPIPLARVTLTGGLTGETGDFVGEVEKTINNLTVDKLIQAKAEGATFGALSEKEWSALQSTASYLTNRRALDNDGNVIGYKTTEKRFKEEMDKIGNYAKLDALLKGADPESIGVTVTDDGKYWTRNSNGEMVDLEELGQTEL